MLRLIATSALALGALALGGCNTVKRFGRDAEGELYLLSKANGKIWKVVGVERVDDDRLGAGRAHRAGLGSRAGRADHLMTARHQLGNEVAADRAGGSGNEDLHDVSVRWAHPQQTRRPGLP